MPRELKNAFAEYALDDRGLLVVRVLSTQTNTLESARAGVQILKQLAAGQRRPLLVDVPTGGDMDAAARQHYIDEAPSYATRVAVVTRSMLSRIVGNFFIGLMASSKEPVPTRLFRDEGEAAAWLTTP